MQKKTWLARRGSEMTSAIRGIDRGTFSFSCQFQLSGSPVSHSINPPIGIFRQPGPPGGSFSLFQGTAEPDDPKCHVTVPPRPRYTKIRRSQE